MPLKTWVGSELSRVVGWMLAGVLCLSGCASLQGVAHVDTDDRLSGPLPAAVELKQVAFFPQTEDQCGPAALATVLHHAGVERTLQQLKADVYLPQRQGSLPLEMLGAARRAGVLPYVLQDGARALRQEVAAGHPVVVLQNLRWDWWPLWHYAVVVGYDQVAGTVTLRSADQERLVMPMADFESSWAKAKHWAFVALPAHQRPTTAQPTEYVNAAIALERVAPSQAVLAYRAALQAWPTHLEARLALGNSLYKQGDLAGAQSQYEQATLYHPHAADAWNNLAQALFELNQPAQAQAAIQQALRLGGPRIARYEATRATINQGSAQAP
jgi:tetratricopeptide (TPR) repeat protein